MATAQPPELSSQLQEDAAQLASMGYQQQLTRALGLFSNFSVGFTYLSPVVGVYALFAYGLATAGPGFFWSIPIVVAGQFLVVLAFAEVSSQYPIAGGVYQWAKRLVGERYAWLAGWMYTWALLITIASVAFSAATYAGPLFGFQVTHTSQVLTAIVILAIGGLVNLTGVRNLGIFARFGLAAELIGTVVLGIIILVHGRHHGLGALFHSYGAGSTGYAGAFLTAALFAIWIFYGFEACGDVAEEVVNPSRKIPRAMMMTLLVGGIASAFITISFTLAVPSFGAVISGKQADPISAIFTASLGNAGSKVALVMVLIAFTSCALAIQAAATRLIYSYARDGMIAGARVLSTVSPRFHMPPGAVALTAIIPAVITLMPTATVARIITFATVGIYLGFQSVVLAILIARSRGWKPAGAFTLGRWGWPVNLAGLAYGVAAIVVLCIKTPAAGSSFLDRWLVPVSVAVVFGIGLLYLVVFRPRTNVREDARAGGAEAAVIAAPSMAGGIAGEGA